jgi:NDP-hexose-3-ketoreductase
LLGWSSIGRRRVVPALARIGVRDVDIASLTRQVTRSDGPAGTVYTSYDDALADSDADLVYISTRNDAHAALARKAIASGRHVVIDKPAALDVRDIEKLVELADQHGRLIAEATVWSWHPQIGALQELVTAAKPWTHVTAHFSFPPMPADNFRMTDAAGGGMLWDLGPYAVSAARVLFGDTPKHLSVAVEHNAGSPIDTAFSVLMQFGEGRTLFGRFGMHTAYVNRLIALAPDLEVTLDRAFTTTPDQPGLITGQRDGAPLRIAIAPADPFALFLEDVQRAIGERRFSTFADRMIQDARALRNLRAAALG